MTDYKEMYYKLFNRITDVIEELKEIQEEVEEMYINGDDNVFVLVKYNKEN